jgi:hypothetical protein
MRFVTDRCVKCGAPRRELDLSTEEVVASNGHLTFWGQFQDTDYWFCSLRCFRDAARAYLPKRYDYDAKGEDDPHVARLLNEWDNSDEYEDLSYEDKKDRVRQLYKDWKGDKLIAIWNAEHEVEQRLLSEQKRRRDEEAAAERAEADRVQQLENEKRLAELAYDELISPKPIPERLRFEHTHILGPSGSGKTTLIQQLILDDIAKPDPPAYVVIDPKGLMVERLSRLAEFAPNRGRLKDRLVVVDAAAEIPPALGIFSTSLSIQSPPDRNRVLNQLIETFAYIFSSSDAKLTQRQAVHFSFIVRLIFSIGGDIETLMDLLDDTSKRFLPYAADLDLGARRFFENDFYDPSFRDTRAQIKTRVYEIMSRPELMAMLGASHNAVSMVDALQQRKIVLINTGMSQLGHKSSTLLGRYFIALTLSAAFARFAIPRPQWTPAFLVIDEFQDFADDQKTPELLRLAREYNLGVILAHQTMHASELNDALRTSISTNTSIKYAASPEGIDAAYVARDMKCEQSFLAQQQKTATHAHFACFARGVAPHPFVVEVPLGNVDQREQMSRMEYALFQAANTQRLKAPARALHAPAMPKVVKPAEPPQPKAAAPSHEPSDKW